MDEKIMNWLLENSRYDAAKLFTRWKDGRPLSDGERRDIASAQAFANGEPTRQDFKAIREGLGLSQSQMAKKLNTPVKTLQGWEMGKKIPGAAWAAIEFIKKSV